MPALTIPSPTRDLPLPDSSAHDSAHNATSNDQSKGQNDESQEVDLDRPPESPLTPTRAPVELPELPPRERFSLPPQRTTFMDHPEPVPVSESTNPDAAALRSAISLLQIQRARSKEHIRTLERIKTEALADPMAFKEELLAGRLQNQDSTDMLGPTLSNDDEDEDMESGDSLPKATSSSSRFGPIPAPQNIIRTPAINWDKYHIVGSPLDKLHEEQRHRHRSIAEPYKIGFADGANTQRTEPKRSI